MANDWSNKEKIALLNDILEYGDQIESWSNISNDLSRLYQTKKEGRYSIKNCKHEYKQLVDRYKSEWIQHGSSNGLKLPLAKYIWIQLKSIYKKELTYQLKENRKKLQEFYLQLESTINIKPNIIETTPSNSIIDISTPINIQNENELLQPQQQKEDKIANIEFISHSISDIQTDESIHSTLLPNENNPNLSSIFHNSLKEESSISDQPQIKEEPQNEIPIEKIISPNQSIHKPESIVTDDTPSLNPFPSDHQIITSLPQPSIQLSGSASSSRSNSRTSSETKTDIVKINPTATTQKYHVYFSPKTGGSNSNPNINTNNIFGTNKNKPKRKLPDDIKDENDNETLNQNEISSSSIEQIKIPSSSSSSSLSAAAAAAANTPMTRRSINTRSVPNTAAEQEEEKSRKFSLMLSENPNSWQSQSMSIIQYLLAHKQGYLFEHEITDEIAPKYHLYIRHPIALDTIRKNLESNNYLTKEYFKRDIYLMLYNAMKYNPRYHHVHRSAKHLFNITNPLFNLSSQEIQAQIITKSSTPLPNSVNENPLIKRQRVK